MKLRGIVLAMSVLASMVVAPATAGTEDFPHVRASMIFPLHAESNTAIGDFDPMFWSGEIELRLGDTSAFSFVYSHMAEDDEKSSVFGKVSLDADRDLFGLRATGYFPALGENAFSYVGGGVHQSSFETSVAGLKDKWEDSGAWVGVGFYKILSAPQGGPSGPTIGVDAKWLDDDGDGSWRVGLSVGWAF